MGSYLHASSAPGVGRMGALVGLQVCEAEHSNAAAGHWACIPGVCSSCAVSQLQIYGPGASVIISAKCASCLNADSVRRGTLSGRRKGSGAGAGWQAGDACCCNAATLPQQGVRHVMALGDANIGHCCYWHAAEHSKPLQCSSAKPPGVSAYIHTTCHQTQPGCTG